MILRRKAGRENEEGATGGENDAQRKLKNFSHATSPVSIATCGVLLDPCRIMPNAGGPGNETQHSSFKRQITVPALEAAGIATSVVLPV